MSDEQRAKYSADDRQRMAGMGQAMPDGSYPIMDREDLANAIRAVGRGNASGSAIRRHIMKRARAMNMTDMIPDTWNSDGSLRRAFDDEFEARLLGAPERRALALTDFALQAGRGDNLTLDGYAATFDVPYEVRGGPDAGGWTETVDPKAFNKTLSRNPDVHLLVNHDGWSLARTRSGTLNLAADQTGLRVRADLDRRDPDVQRLEVKMERGDMNEMSFSFRTLQHDLNRETAERRLIEVSIDKGDVSIVNNGANPSTNAAIRSVEEALEVLAHADLAEVRNASNLTEALAVVNNAATNLDTTARRTLSVAQAERLMLLDA